MDTIRVFRSWFLLLAIFLGVSLLCTAGELVYSVYTLNWALKNGVYESPQQAVYSIANQWFCGIQRIDIESAGTNSLDGSDPHVWYVTWEVHAENYAPCGPGSSGPPLRDGKSELGGSFFLDTHRGWVWIPEQRFPGMVGHWLRILGLAGPGEQLHVTDK